MSKKRRAGIIGLVLLGVYSLIMNATAGTAATYSRVMLAAAIGLVATTAHRFAAEKHEGHDG